MNTVYVVTNVESGWDCVRGVFSTKRLALERIVDEDYSEELTDEELESIADEKYDRYIIHEESFN